MSVVLTTALLLAPTADAGTLTVTRKGITPAVLHVDGDKQGKVKKTEPVKVNTKDGPHEVAISLDPEGVFVRCIGNVDVSGTTKVTVTDQKCDGLADGKPIEQTLARGAWIRVRGPEVGGRPITVDGGRAWFLPEDGVLLNVAPGKHIVSLPDHCTGTVVVKDGETAALVVGAKSCDGFTGDGTPTKKEKPASDKKEKPTSDEGEDRPPGGKPVEK